MRVFVIGGTGALGRHVVPLLLTQGHQVTAVGRSAARLHELAAHGAKPLLADLFDAGAIRTGMAGHDAVINIATRVPAPMRMLLPGAWKEMDRVRTQGAAIVAGAARATGVARLIQESYAAIYPDRGDRWIAEDTAPTPARFNRSVVAAETSALGFAMGSGDAVVLRFGMFYGPGDQYADKIFASVRKGWAPFLGSPDGYVSMVTLADAAAATVAALKVPTGVYNIVDDEPMTRRDITHGVARLLGARDPKFPPSWVAWLGGSLGETLARSLRISNRKFRTAGGWAPGTRNALAGLQQALSADAAAAARRA